MATTIHCQGNEPEVLRIAHAAFPEYIGRTLEIRSIDGPLDLRSSWDGGSRSYFRLIRLDTLQAVSVPAMSAFDQQYAGADAVTIPPEIACVEHVIFCGKDLGLRIHLHPDNLSPLLPAGPNATREQRIVLIATRSYKNSYGGQTECRFREAQRETGISRESWESAVAECQTKGWLNAAKAITPSGKNIAQWNDIRSA